MRVCPNCNTRFAHDEPFCPHDGMPTFDPDAPKAVNALLGAIVDNRYRIEKQIGEGGMGVVYEATHTVIGKKFCLKVLKGDLSRDHDVVQRFIQEARVAGSIGHENIVAINDFGRLPDGSVYLAMELLEGEPLTALIKRGGSVPMQDAITIIRQIASALGAAHSRSIVHRDLKPDNVFLTRRANGTTFVKVLDFGIAKVAGGASKLTRTGTVFGTPHYMSPEQAAGQSVDARTDIYALGVIMYEMFTGKVPFDADTFMGILTKHMFEPPVPLSEATNGVRLGAVEDITLRALQKKPENRYQTMEQLVEDLDRIEAGGHIAIGAKPGVQAPAGLADALEPPSRTEMRLGVAARAPVDPEPAPKSRTGLVFFALIAAAVLFVVGVGTVGIVVWLRTKAPADGPTAAVVSPPTHHTGSTTPGTSPSASPNFPVASPPPGVPSPVPSAAGVTPPSPGVSAAVPGIATVSLVTSPPGARVYSEQGALLGLSPFDLQRPSDGIRVFDVRLDGYRSERVQLEPVGPQRIDLALEPESVASRGPTKGRRIAGSRDPAASPNPGTSMANTSSMRTTPDLMDPW